LNFEYIVAHTCPEQSEDVALTSGSRLFKYKDFGMPPENNPLLLKG